VAHLLASFVILIAIVVSPLPRLDTPRHEPARPDPSVENAKLRYELLWNFGGKEQRGWAIYIPLISEMVGADADKEPLRFTQVLTTWQANNQLPATGILERDTLMWMVGMWQDVRFRERERLALLPLELVTGRSDEFYDPEREEELRQLEVETYDAYKQMYAAAKVDLALEPDSQFLKIISAYRTKAYQEKLRKEAPKAGRGALAVDSPHFSGRALDLYVGAEPVTTKDLNRLLQINTPAYRWLVKNAHTYGFVPYFYEPWHWEYQGVTKQ